MKFYDLLITLLVFELIYFNVLATTPLFPFLGPCQKRCITQFGEIKERTTNTDSVYREIDVFNKTEFSLCKLGCNSPEYTDLNLPAFRYGQSAYKKISLNSDDKPPKESVVKDVSILCLDNFPYVAKNTTAILTNKRVLTGTVLLSLDDGVPETDHVYFIEAVARDADDEDTYILYQDWCYSSSCNLTFNTPIETSSGLEVRLRVSTFDENGPVGGIVLSRWYNINHILANTSVDMTLKSVVWNDDKAAAQLAFDQEKSIHVPTCSLEMMYKNTLSGEYKHFPFYLDRTREIIIKKLDFNQTYTMRLVPASDSNRPSTALAVTKFQVPPCSDMVNDMTMCAPPPVSALTPHWNLSSTNGYGLVIEWTYFSDEMMNQSLPLLPMSHFMFFVHPLITANNEKCGKYEPIRRDVTYTHRKVVFYVPDAECNYEVEVSAFDTKQRMSEIKKIKIHRVNPPSYMYLLTSDMTTSIGLGVLFVITVLILVVIAGVFIHKRKKDTKKIDDENYGTGERMVYAYVDATDASKTVIGVRPLNFRLEPVENINRNIEAALAQRTYGYNLQNGTRRAICQNELYPYYQPQNQFRREPREPRILQNNMESSRTDHTYATILDFRSETDLSDEVFEDCSSSNHSDSSTVCPLPPIAPFEYFDSFTAYPLQDFRIRPPNEPLGSQYWLTTNAMDTVRGQCYTLKISKDYSEQTMAAMRKELDFLRTLPPHQNCVSAEGVLLSKWDNIPYQIVGILMECCRGGSLHNYIISVGSVLRRHVIGTPDTVATGRVSKNEDLPLRSYNGSPNPSSGYDSFSSKDRTTPETQTTDGGHHYGRVSIRFSQFAEQISSALEHLHRSGIVHSRVTTISVYLLRDYTDPLDMLCDQMVKLGDFGNAARNADDVIVDQSLQPPEVALGKKYEAKGDIWQFGTCLAEMCSLGVPYQAQKQIPLSGLEEFDKLPSTGVLQDAAKRCLNPRNRPSASDLRGLFQTDTARDIKALDMATMDQMKQSLLI